MNSSFKIIMYTVLYLCFFSVFQFLFFALNQMFYGLGSTHYIWILWNLNGVNEWEPERLKKWAVTVVLFAHIQQAQQFR